MSAIWLSNGGVATVNGQPQICDECPCGCPPFEGRGQRYVDKYAADGGDGLSWATAYNDLQQAINDFRFYQINIQGYGKSDPYIPLSPYQSFGSDNPCVYLSGVDDAWFTDNGTVPYPIGVFVGFEQAKFININTCGGIGFYSCLNIEISDCLLENDSIGVESCSYSEISNCIANNGLHSYRAGTGNILTNCIANDCIEDGFEFPFSTYIDCIANSCGRWGFVGPGTYVNCQALSCGLEGFIYVGGSVLTDCLADSCGRVGFRSGSNSTFINCIARNNQSCGFFANTSAVFDSCSDINNCLSGYPTCTPSDPSYVCDTV